MVETGSSAESVAAGVAEALQEAEREAGWIVAAAEDQASQAGAENLAELRRELARRIDRLRELRSGLDQHARSVRGRLNQLAADLTRAPAEVAATVQSTATESAVERALGVRGETGEAEDARASDHLAAVAKAADAAAERIVEEARTRARQAIAVARREAEEAEAGRPRQLARIYDPAIQSGESVRKQLARLVESLDRGDAAVGRTGANRKESR